MTITHKINDFFTELLPESEVDHAKLKELIKKIAMELATVGMSGIDPKKDGYHIPSIEGSSFSGYKTLAYYYVSWAIAIPEMLSQLQMPFDKEYDLAKKMIDSIK